jgi:hypothetical protein
LAEDLSASVSQEGDHLSFLGRHNRSRCASPHAVEALPYECRELSAVAAAQLTALECAIARSEVKLIEAKCGRAGAG